MKKRLATLPKAARVVVFAAVFLVVGLVLMKVMASLGKLVLIAGALGGGAYLAYRVVSAKRIEGREEREQLEVKSEEGTRPARERPTDADPLAEIKRTLDELERLKKERRG